MKFFFDCDEFLKYLYNNKREKVQIDTAIDNGDATISITTWRKWLALNIEHLDEERIDALNKNGTAKIAIFQEEDIESLCETIKMDASTPNAKRVFNMLISSDSNLKYVHSDGGNTPLAKYMKYILNVNKDVYYLPGRSVDLSMLCHYGIKTERIASQNDTVKNNKPQFKEKGILAGLKALVGLGLVEAFKVVETKPDVYEADPVKKEEITANEDIIYRLSMKGCADYMNKAKKNQDFSSK